MPVNYSLGIGTFGNQNPVGGTPAPYEVQVLSNSGTTPVKTNETASLTAITTGTTGTFLAGALSVFFENTGVTDILVDGEVVTAGKSVNFPASDTGILTAISYNRQTSSILIGEVR